MSAEPILVAERGRGSWIASRYDPALSGFIAEAISRLLTEMRRHAPFLAERFSDWINGKLARKSCPEDYYRGAGAYPTLLFPWYLAEAVHQDTAGVDSDFHADLVYSSINGYYFIRLLDNIMDGEADLEFQILPSTGILHWQFLSAYQPYFPDDHPFWSFARSAWAAAANATAQDAALQEIGEQEFLAVCGRKSGAAKIPIAAVCHRYGRPDLIAPWSNFIDRFGAWHQMVNDLFGWEKDSRLGHRTFVTCQADRWRDPEELVADWIAREGFEWGAEILSRWISELRIEAAHLGCPAAVTYIEKREEWLAAEIDRRSEGLRALAHLLRVIRKR